LLRVVFYFARNLSCFPLFKLLNWGISLHSMLFHFVPMFRVCSVTSSRAVVSPLNLEIHGSIRCLPFQRLYFSRVSAISCFAAKKNRQLMSSTSTLLAPLRPVDASLFSRCLASQQLPVVGALSLCAARLVAKAMRLFVGRAFCV